MRLALVAVIAVVALAGYYELHKQAEHTNAFIRCLRQSGGTQITRPAQLRGYPSRDVQPGDGAAFETLAYESIDVALPRHRRQELVLVEHSGDQPDAPATAGDLLRQARRGHVTGERALVLMPPTNEADLDADIERCESRADPPSGILPRDRPATRSGAPSRSDAVAGHRRRPMTAAVHGICG